VKYSRFRGSEICDGPWQGEGPGPVMRDVTLQKLKKAKQT